MVMDRRRLMLGVPGLMLAARLRAHEAEVLHVYPGRLTPIPGAPGQAIATFEIHAGDTPDALVGASSPAAAKVVIVGRDGRPTSRLAVRAEEDLALRVRGAHLRLVGIDGPLRPGREIMLQLRFERAGELAGSVLVPGPGR